MLRDDDDVRIELLKKRTGAKSKVAVVRSALDLLQREVERAEKVARWRRAVAKEDARELRRTLKDFAAGHRKRLSGLL